MKATIEDGRSVLLHENGTWEFVDEVAVADPDERDFRKVAWGASKAAIQSRETAPPNGVEDDSLWYATSLVSLDCLVIYILVQNQLVRAKYLVTQEFSNQNNYLSAFETLKENLSKKYGKPEDDNHFWHNDLYADDFQEWGTAVSIGHLSFFTMWETPTTDICLALTGENDQVSLVVEYTSKRLKQLEEQRNQAQLFEDI